MRSPRTTHHDISVWIVEDHREYRQTVAYLLDKTSGIRCSDTFHEYEEVQALMATNQSWNVPDVVLMDYELPGLNGIEALKHLKSQLPRVPILMLTINDDEDTILGALKAGASGYLLKDDPLDKLVAAIREAHQGGMLMPPSVAGKVMQFFSDTQPRHDYRLTAREKQILKLMGQGFSQKKIAHTLFLSYHTIDSHLRNIYRKLHVKSRIEAIAKVFGEHIV